jgi:cation diffusion facilitator CzcD-associated flavoprotein CzcO
MPYSYSDPNYKVREQPLGTTRHIRVITIGAGASGINVIRTLRDHIGNFEHVVYEKNPVIGGTWYENRYPGCKCDIPSHNYQYSWRPNPAWSSFFSPAKEIEEYLCQLCEEEGLSKYIKTSHVVDHAEWNEEQGCWKLKVRNLLDQSVFEDTCHFLLDASGILK